MTSASETVDSLADDSFERMTVPMPLRYAVSTDENVEMNVRFNSEHALITMAACSFATIIVTAKMVSIIRENNREQTENTDEQDTKQ